MNNDEQLVKEKKSIFETPVLSTKVKSLKTKIFPEGAIGYFIGPVLAILSNSVMNAYLNKYYTDILGLTEKAYLFSILLPVVSVIFVILGNLLVGKLMSKARTKAGKARPLMLIGLPLIVAALLFNFYMPSSLINSSADDATGMLIWVAVGYNLYYAVAFPFYYTSHSALVNLSTRNTRDRSLLATVSNATSLAATGLVSMLMPFLINLFLFVTETDASGNAVTLIDESVSGWRVFVIVLAIFVISGILLEYYFTRERVTEELFALRDGVTLHEDGETQTATKDQKSVSTVKQFKAVRGDKFWWIIIIFFVLYQLGGMLKNNSQLYFAQAYFQLDNGASLSGTISIVGAIPTALGMLIVWPISNKIGKAKTILIGAILAVGGGLLGFIAPDNAGMVLFAFAVKSLGSAPAMYISLALMGDVLDHNEARHGFRSDGLTMTIYGSIMIGMSGLANGIINGFLGATGYTATDEWLVSDAASAYRNLMLFTYFGGETICYALIALIMFFMRVEKYSERDHRVIYDRQKAEALAQGIPWVEPEERQRIEQEELDAKNEEDRKLRLKAKCEKLGLNFEQEEAKYQATVVAKKKAAEEKKEAKKKAAEEKKAAKEKAKADAIKAKEETRLAKLKAYCEANNLSFNDEEEKYQKELALKEKAKAERKAAWNAKMAERERKLDEKESIKDKKAVEMWATYDAKLAAKGKK